MISLTRVVEKPSLEFARHYLTVPGMKDDTFLSMFGIYALSGRIFDFLRADLANRPPPHNLTTSLDKLRAEEGLNGLLVRGRRYPLRSPQDLVELYAAADTRSQRTSSEPLTQERSVSPLLAPAAPAAGWTTTNIAAGTQ